MITTICLILARAWASGSLAAGAPVTEAVGKAATAVVVRLLADVLVEVLGGGFRRLDGQAMRKISLAVIVGGLELVELFAGGLADGHNLEGDDVHLP